MPLQPQVRLDTAQLLRAYGLVGWGYMGWGDAQSHREQLSEEVLIKGQEIA